VHIFSVGSIKIRCSILVLLVIPLSLIFGKAYVLLTALLSLSLHELSHTLIAGAVGYKVVSVDIQPFGFMATLSGNSLLPDCEIAIAAGGPVCSLIAAVGAVAAGSAFPEFKPLLMPFEQFNLMLAAVNLVPALPLDGGRILRALLSKSLRPRTASLICIWIGIVAGTALTSAAVYLILAGEANATAAIMGFFLLAAAIKELRNIDGAQLSAVMARSDSLRRGERLKIIYTAMHCSATAGDALKVTHAGHYNVIMVVDDTMRSMGEIDEGTLIEGIARHGKGITIGKLVKRP
jgi:stage IV sporulation protein FB